jgi:hypothetical protein
MPDPIEDDNEMIGFVVHTAEGKIVQIGTCMRRWFGAQVAGFPDHTVIEATASPRVNYIKNGEVRTYPEVPSPYHVFDYQAEAWVDPRTTEQLREQHRAMIKTRRDQAIKSGITVNGLQIATDEVSQTRIMGAAVSAMLDTQYSVQWKVTETDFVTLGATQIIQIAQLVRAHVQACFDNEATLLGLVAAGQPFDIESGWPV